MKSLKIGVAFVWLALGFFLIENIYFGWNEYPVTELEKTADDIVQVLFTLGVVFYLSPLLEIYKKVIKELKL